MADEIKFKLEFDDGDLLRSFSNLETQVSKIEDSIDKVKDSAEDMGKEASDAANNSEKEYKKLNDAVLEAKNNTLKWVDSISIAGVSIGDVRNKLKEFSSAVSNVGKAMFGLAKGTVATNTAMKALTVATKAFRVALISTGIGAVVVALGSLVAYFTRTQKGIDAVNRQLAGLKAGFDVIVDRLATFGEVITLVFQRKFKEAGELAQGILKGIGDEIVRETKIAKDLETRYQNLVKATRDWSIEEAELRAQYQEQKSILEDTTKSFDERRKAGQKALEIRKKVEEESIKLAQERLDIIKEQNNQGNSLNADLDAQAEAEAELARLRRESVSEAKEARNQLNALYQQELARLKALEKAYESYLSNLEQSFEEARIANLGGVEAIMATYNNALKDIDAQEKELRETAKEAGKTVTDEQIKGFDQLRERAFRDFLGEMKSFKEEVDSNRDVYQVSPIQTTLEKADEEKIKLEVSRVLNSVKKETDNVFETLKYDIADALGLSPDKWSEFTAFLGEQGNDILTNAIDILQVNLQNQLAEIDQRIEASKERISEINQELQEERRLQEQGFANDVSVLEEKLRQETALQAQAQKDRLEIEQKAAKQQLLIDTALQASQIATSIAKLINAEASKGLIGIITATSAVALLFSLVAASKRRALEASQPPKFREGTEYLQGNSHERGGVLIEAEGGERILSKKLNSRLTGIKNDQLVDYALFGQSMSKRLAYASLQGNNDRLAYEQAQLTFQSDAIKSAIYDAMDNNASRVIEYWKGRPVVIPTPQGTITEAYDGATKVKRKYRSI